jgi:hypothetical protein
MAGANPASHRRFDNVTTPSEVFVVSPAPLVDVLKAVEEAATPAGGHR